MDIIGRKKEKEELENIYKSNKSELVALTGRRRVGKTYLVNQLFGERISFYHVGVSPQELKNNKKRKMNAQLDAFYASLLVQGFKCKKPKDWFEAFSDLIEFLKTKNSDERILVFIDEFPWLDTPKSNFISAFEWFWNFYGANQKNLMFIICGSSTSWMLNKVINSHGGLYNRITYSIHLSPFSLKECELYFRHKNYDLNRYMIALIYMVFGGIPYYLNYYENGKSISQMIDELFFKGDKLSQEYDNLFESSFDSEKLAKRIVEFLSMRKKGFSRKEFLDGLKISDGEDVGKTLKALINSDFVLEYIPFGKTRKNKYYKVIDPFCLFYLKHIKECVSLDENAFNNNDDSKNWVGASFENLCASHLENIKKKVGINGIKTMQFSLFVDPNEEGRGSQIDLIIERKDKVIHLFEMKFYNKEFSVDKSYHLNLMNKIDNVKKLSKNNTGVFLALITTFGLEKSSYYYDFSNVITIDDLFE